MIGVVRHGSLDDLPAVGVLHARSRRTAYRGIIPDDLLDAVDAAELAHEWRAKLVADPDGHRLLVATDDDGAVVGFAFVGGGWLYSIHVDAIWQGRGIGGRLLDAAMSALAGLGFDTARLWVVAENRRARSVYEHRGWIASGRECDDEISGAPTHSIEYTALTRS